MRGWTGGYLKISGARVLAGSSKPPVYSCACWVAQQEPSNNSPCSPFERKTSRKNQKKKQPEKPKGKLKGKPKGKLKGKTKRKTKRKTSFLGGLTKQLHHLLVGSLTTYHSFLPLGEKERCRATEVLHVARFPQQNGCGWNGIHFWTLRKGRKTYFPPPKGEIPTKSITWNKLRVINHKPEMENLSAEKPLSKLRKTFFAVRFINHNPEMETLSVENPLSKLLNILPWIRPCGSVGMKRHQPRTGEFRA